MAQLFFESVKKFGFLDKLGGITVDNAYVNNTFFDELQKIMHREGYEFDKELVMKIIKLSIKKVINNMIITGSL